MRLLLAIVVLAALGWSGWWLVNARAREAAVEDWLAERRAAGWVADTAGLRVTGFPNRLDTVVTGLELADPDAAWSWSANAFEIRSMTWKPHHVIAVWPGTQVVASPFETVTVTSDRMRGSVIFEPNLTLRLDRSTIEIADMTLSGASGWQAGLGKAILATRQADAPAPDFAHDIAFDAEDVVLPAAWTSEITLSGVLPAAVEALAFDATVVFDRPWDRVAVETDNPVLAELRIRDVSLAWGKLDLRGQGILVADARGFAQGTLDLRARNWREMLDIAEAAGALGAGTAGAVRTGLDLLARLSGDRNTLSVPLAFEGGRTRLGPIVLGDAPRLARRNP